MKRIHIATFVCFFPFLLNGQPSGNDKPAVKEIIVICKTHFDIGYTHRLKDVVQYYQTTMIDKAMGVMKESEDMPREQQFAWTLPGWVLSKTLEDWPGQTPERHQKLVELLQSGKIAVHAMPFTMESDACEPEELTRGLGLSSQLARTYGLPLPRSGKQTDVPSHANAYATVLANAGVKFLHIGCNWPSGFVQTPGLFWWEGPDQSRVLTFYSASYGTISAVAPEWIGPNDPLMGEKLTPPKDWPYAVWPAILVTGDNSGPPTSKQVKELFDDAKKKMPGVNVHMGTMDDFYDAIMKENPAIPVVKGEMPDTWVHGIMCDPDGSRLSREVHPLIASAEALNTQLRSWGVEMPSVTSSIARAYEEISLYGEHTWGGSISVNVYGEAFKKLLPAEYADLEASWKDKTDHIREASAIAHALNSANMEQLAASVKCKSPCIVVYNPLPWERSGMVEVAGKQILVKDVPPCGYRTFPYPSGKQATKTETTFSRTIENDFYRISFNPEKGIIESLIDKRTGREWVDRNSQHGLGQYLNERFTLEQTMKYTAEYQQGRAGEWLHPGIYKPGMISEKETPYRAASSANGKLTISGDAGSQVAELSMPGDPANHLPPSILRVTLYKKQPYVDLELTIKDKEKDNWPEADWFCLPFNIDKPAFSVYRSLGVMNPVTDILPGANRHLYTVGNGVVMTGSDGAGIAVCPLDHPLISLDTPGCWKFSCDFVPQKPVVYVNLYNNQWNTNFRYWYPGTWSSRVRVWTTGKETDKNPDFTSRALEARNPLQAIVAEKGQGTLPPVQSGLKVSRKGVIVTALGADPDGNSGTLLRVWEQAGVAGKLTLALPKGMNVSMATPVNLRGEITGKPVNIKSGMLEFELNAYAPASFILE